MSRVRSQIDHSCTALKALFQPGFGVPEISSVSSRDLSYWSPLRSRMCKSRSEQGKSEICRSGIQKTLKRRSRPTSRRLCVSLVEGWRGEICHVAETDGSGRLAHYKIVDPSFHNWTGLSLAMRGQQISDFPLCNKSFNLSYCGFDL